LALLGEPDVVVDQILLDWAYVAIVALAVGVLIQELGILSLGHAGIVLSAAYLTAFVAFGQLSILQAILAAGLPVVLIGLVAMRLRDDVFAVVTLALSETLRLFVIGADSLTHGALGLGPIMRADWLASAGSAALLAWSVFSLMCLVVVFLLRRWTGLELGAIRDGDLYGRAVGIHVQRTRFIAVSGSAAVAAVAGVLQVGYYGLAAPSAGGLDVSLQAIAAVIIGWPFWKQGRPFRNVVGLIVGSGVIVTLPPLLRQIGAASAETAVLRQAVFGGLLFCLVHPRSPLSRMFVRR
jgi:branched-chain amino acid transport system permease protein